MWKYSRGLVKKERKGFVKIVIKNIIRIKKDINCFNYLIQYFQ